MQYGPIRPDAIQFKSTTKKNPIILLTKKNKSFTQESTISTDSFFLLKNIKI